jgi:opacity protein-like surface antigen
VGDVDVTVRAGAGEAYDDNITFANTNKKNDSSTNLNLGVDGKYEGKTRSLTFSADLSRQFFDTYTNFDNTSENASLTYNQEFSKYKRMSLKDSFTHSQEPRSLEDEFGRTSGRYSYSRNNISLDYTADISKQLSLIWRYANEIYDPSRKDLSNSYMNKLGVEADFAFNSQTIGYATYDFSYRTFDPGTSATFNILGAGLRQYFTNQLYADLRAGIDFIDSFNDRTYTKPSYQFSLTDEFDKESQLTLAILKEYSANAYSEDLFNYWQVSAALARQLLQRLRVNLNVFYGRGEYINFDINDRLRGAAMGLDYDLLHNLKLNLSYSYSKTVSNFSSRDYTRNYVSAGLRMEF